MQNDDVIWQVISKDFCSFKVKTLKDEICRNEYNVTGKCNRVSCPLANSNYATVLSVQGNLILCLKTVERAHLPRTMWEEVKLPLNVEQARRVIEQEMRNVFKAHQIERCKRRMIKLKQMLDRMRRSESTVREKLVPVKRKTERREAARERKAEAAAQLDDVIESELLKRLHQGVYGSIYNIRVSTERNKKVVEVDFESKEEYAEGAAASDTKEEDAVDAGFVKFEQDDIFADEEETFASEADLEVEDYKISDMGPPRRFTSRDEQDVEDLGNMCEFADEDERKTYSTVLEYFKEAPCRNEKRNGNKINSTLNTFVRVPRVASSARQAQKRPLTLSVRTTGRSLECENEEYHSELR